jgi:DnaJ-domain-containing protein 1
MNSDELLVIIAGLFFGYLIVNYFLNKKNGDDSKTFKEEDDTFSSQNQNKQDRSSSESHYKKSTDGQSDISINWFRILEVSESALPNEISVSYKRLIRQYHPDKVASLGKDLQDLANHKAKQINAAYDYAKRIKN